MAKNKITVESISEETFKAPIQDANMKATKEILNDTVEEIKEEAKETFSRTNINSEVITDKEEINVIKSKNFIRNFMTFIRSNKFYNSCDRLSKKTHVSKKQIAHNFLEHVLGTISDVFHIVIETVEDVVTTVLDVLSKVLSAAASVICDVARKLVRVVTLNKTCVE